MFESNLLGTHPAFFETSMKTHTIVHEKDLPINVIQEDIIWDTVVQKYDGKGYDFGGAAYLGLVKLLNRIMKFDPQFNFTKNAWAKDNEYFCEEIVTVLEMIPGFPKIENPSMKTPEDLWQCLKDWTYQ